LDLKGQASLEYMVMLGLSLAVFMVIMYISGNLLSSSSAQIGLNSASNAVHHLRESADFVYIQGHPSKTQVNVYIPPNIRNITLIQNKSVMASIVIESHHTDIYGVSRAELVGDLSPIEREGYYVVNVETVSDKVVNLTVL